MAQNIFEKINILVSANLHAMVDKALETNSLKVMDEYIRRAENNLDELETQIVTVGGSVRTLKRKYEETSSAAEKLDRDIDTMLTQAKTDLAARMQSDLNAKQQQAQTYYEQWQGQESEYKKMLDAKLKLEGKMNATRDERHHLAELLKLAEAKRVTTKTIKSLKDIQGVGDEDIRRIGDAIRARLDREDAQLEVSSARLQEQVDDAIETSQVDAQLEERRRRLGLGANSGPASS
jgi:phage shock protein A